ncbi:hypothetical protein ACFQEX_14740 [Roseibium salinum]|uniref:hypothetical protein n=1 Tax=Roseibium salinum TaxID=1604349 RepID=UPI0036191CA3
MKSVILDYVVEIFDLHRTTEAPQQSIDPIDPGGVGAMLIDHDLARHTVCFLSTCEEFVGRPCQRAMIGFSVKPPSMIETMSLPHERGGPGNDAATPAKDRFYQKLTGRP